MFEGSRDSFFKSLVHQLHYIESSTQPSASWTGTAQLLIYATSHYLVWAKHPNSCRISRHSGSNDSRKLEILQLRTCSMCFRIGQPLKVNTADMRGELSGKRIIVMWTLADSCVSVSSVTNYQTRCILSSLLVWAPSCNKAITGPTGDHHISLTLTQRFALTLGFICNIFNIWYVLI